MGLRQADDQQLEQAVDWYLLMSSGDADAADKQAFAKWLSDPIHAETYAKLEKVWARFDQVSEPVERQALNQSLTRKSSITENKSVRALVIAGLCLSAWLCFDDTNRQLILADHLTINEQQTIRLEDQSILRIAPKSAVNIDFDDNLRTIELVRGSLQIDVAKDVNRPLIIETSSGTAEALGTIYSVTKLAEKMQVKVIESAVRVCPNLVLPDHSNCLSANAGEQVDVEQGNLQWGQHASGRLEINWHKQRLIVEDRPLIEVLEVLQRYHFGYLKIDSRSLREFNISGTFPLDDIPQSLDIIATSLGLEVGQYTSALTTIKKK